MTDAIPPAPESDPLELQWRHWPLAAYLPWSLVVPVTIVATGFVVSVVYGSPIAGVVAALVLAVSLAGFLLPREFIVHSGGFQRAWLGPVGRSRVHSWHALRAYQPRATGLALFDRPHPVPLAVLRAEFLPYGDDPDELLCAVREFAPHAEELPPQ